MTLAQVDDRSPALTAPGHDRRVFELNATVALIAVALLGLNQPIALGLTTGTVVVLGLVPVWAFHLFRYRFAKLIVALALAAIVVGTLLMVLSQGRDYDPRLALDSVMLLVTGIGGVGLLLWARSILPTYRVVVAFGLGYLLSVLPNLATSDNPWKYQLSIPLSLIALALVSRSPRLWPTLTTLSVIGLISIATNSRSFFGFCLLAGALVLWQHRPVSGERPMNKLATVGLIALLLAGMYSLGTSLLAGGYLGEEAQNRTVAQIQEGGSLLAGGRPEWTATWQLMQTQPMGLGLGAVPNSEDIWTAKEGLKSVGIETNNGYVDNFMFAGQVKLHSIIADLWASYGLVGLALGLFLAWVLVYSLLDRLAERRATGLVCLFAIIGVWDLAFGPIFTNLRDVMIALAILLPAANGIGRDRERVNIDERQRT